MYLYNCRRSKDFPPPLRVKRINLPFSYEEEEEHDTLDSFKPLDTHHGNGKI